MPSKIIQSKINEIAVLCEQHGVERLDVFGSALRADFDSESDIDFLVVFRRDGETNAFRQYFDFKESLESLLERKVDLVCASAMRNSHFIAEVESTKEPLYAA